MKRSGAVPRQRENSRQPQAPPPSVWRRRRRKTRIGGMQAARPAVVSHAAWPALSPGQRSVAADLRGHSDAEARRSCRARTGLLYTTADTGLGVIPGHMDVVGLVVRDGGPQARSCPAGVLKKSASGERTARELAGRSLSTAAMSVRPARASATWAAGGPAVRIWVAVSVMPSPESTSKTPP